MTVSELIEELRKYPADMPVASSHECAFLNAPHLEVEKAFLGEKGYKFWDHDGAKEVDLLCIA